MRVLRSSQRKTTPWKNGGGETTEIAVSPPGAGLDNFDWRVSTARVAKDGPFSTFPGVDRTLAVLSGAGVSLRVGGRPPVTLTTSTPPFAFPADLPTRAELLQDAIADLNVMVRRGKFTHRVTHVPLEAPHSLSVQGTETLLFCVEGMVRVETSQGVDTLASRDALWSEGKNSVWCLSPVAVGFAFLVEIWAAAPSGR